MKLSESSVQGKSSMIISAKEIHRKQIVSLWSNAFGDSKDSVNKYLDTLLKYFLVYEEDGIVKGMLSVLPVNLQDKKGGYIYAVVTHPDFRGKGICRAMIDAVKADVTYDFLVLVPQNEGLFNFYGKMDFIKVNFLKKGQILISGNSLEDYSLNRISASEYELARNNFYKNQKFINWDSSILEFAENMYGGSFYEILNGKNSVGYAFLYKEKDSVIIKELLCKNHIETAMQIGSIMNVRKVNFVYEDIKANPTFMVYPEVFSNTKFGIFLD